VLALIYLDCLGGILLGRGSFGFGQLFWHLLTIALTLLLAALGDRRPTPLDDEPPRTIRSSLVILGAASLGLFLGLLEVAGFAQSGQVMPLHWLVVGIALASLLLLGLAAVLRLGFCPMRPLFHSGRFN
jgi:hypothetical protein